MRSAVAHKSGTRPDLHPAILGVPAVKRRLADIVFGAHRPDRGVAFGFSQYPDDLFFAEFALSHSSAALPFRSRTLLLSRPVLWGQVILAPKSGTFSHLTPASQPKIGGASSEK